MERDAHYSTHRSKRTTLFHPHQAMYHHGVVLITPPLYCLPLMTAMPNSLVKEAEGLTQLIPISEI
jgi:hypothetical protein